ncbi:MAG: MupA/Atu3671 family FMN-dependent luciferase-like monooxygenase [Actinomycetota bacterium]
MRFSLFFFAADAAAGRTGSYDLLLDGARFGDRNGLEAVWTPERHFHRFGGLYPSPAVAGAAIASVTERIAVRGGSVVAPLHDVLRIAEDWAVLDNLSRGRAGLSLASGWREEDFELRPGAFEDRNALTIDAITSLRRLWAGEGIDRGRAGTVSTFPAPVDGPLPLWLTAASKPATFRAAGEAGVGVLTHLMMQSFDDLAERISEYRDALRSSDRSAEGCVTLMLHTYLADDVERAQQVVAAPLENYLMDALGLFRSVSDPVDESSAARSRLAVRRASSRVMADGLIGTPESTMEVVRRCAAIGVDEIACLIDFGVADDAVMESLERVADLSTAANRSAATGALVS